MKKNFKTLTLASAYALASTLALTACSSASDDVVAEETATTTFGNYSNGAVKTEIAINVNTKGSTSNGAKPVTRMSDEITQQKYQFHGMKNIEMLLFNTNPDSAQTATHVALSDIDKDKISRNNSSKIYSDVQLEVGTKNIVLFAESAPSVTDKATVGALNIDYGEASKKNVEITLQSIKAYNGNESAYNTSSGKIIDGLNAILKAARTYMGSMEEGDAKTTLSNAITSFTDCGKTYSYSHYAVINRLNGFAALLTGLTSDWSALKTKFNEATTLFTIGNDNTFAFSDSATDNDKNFPEAIGLPQGLPLLVYGESSGFFGQSNGQVNGNDIAVNTNNVCYPSELIYYVNTPIRTTNSDLTVEGTFTWPVTTNDWSDDTKWTNIWTGTETTANTKGVALKNNVQYGVATLETKVKCTTNNGYLTDNAVAFGAESATNVQLDNKGFPVTGIVVGEQPTSVNWQLVGVMNKAEERPNVVYDKAIPEGTYAPSNAYGNSNFTLLLDNWAQQDTQGAVSVALELENNTSTTFYGVDGKIAPGQRFYMVGSLNIADANTKSFTWPSKTNFNIAHHGVGRVFIQDFKTTASFNITSLKNAHVTLPDLRSTQATFGVSVDLQWTTGYEFEATID